MRVLMVLNEFPSAYQTFIIRQIGGLMARGHDVHVVSKLSVLEVDAARHSFPDIDWPRLQDRLVVLSDQATRVARARAIARPGLRGLLLVPAWRRQLRIHRDAASVYGLAIADRLRGARFDIVHAQFGPLGNVALAAVAAGLPAAPIVTAFRGSDATSHLRRHPRVYDLLKQRGDAFLPVSSNLRDVLLREGFPEDRVHVVPSPIHTADFPFHPPGEASAPFRLAAVGRLVDKKGFDDAVRALGHLVRRGVDATLDVYGDGPNGSRLSSLAETEGVAARILQHGRVTPQAVAAAIGEAHALVVPSVQAPDGDEEGIPNVIKEAMALGTPVVATQHGGVRDIIEDGHTGWLVPQRDPLALADAIRDALTNHDARRNRAIAAHAHLRESFEVAAVTTSLEGAYHRAIAQFSRAAR